MRSIIIFVASLAISSYSAAALHIRDIDGNPANGHEGVYDDVLDITWLADANLASSERFGIEAAEGVSFHPNGLMNWRTTQDWLAAMNTHNGGRGWLGHNGWRLPVTNPVNGSEFNIQNSWDGSTDAGGWITAPIGTFNSNGQSANFIGNELAYHYYNNFGGLAPFAGEFDSLVHISSSLVGLENASDPNGYLNLFVNIHLPTPFFWTGTEHEASFSEIGGEFLFRFRTDGGVQDVRQWNNGFKVWAVHDGDIGAVPIPAAAWLFFSALCGLFGFACVRKQESESLPKF